MYLASMVLKHHENEGQPAEELPIVEWACRELLYQAQEQLHSVLRNFPNRALAGMMRLLIFPRGLTYFAPSDRLGHRVADLVLNDSDTRSRLSRLVYRSVEPGNPLGALQQVLELAAVAEPLERKLRIEGQKAGRLSALDLPGQIRQARALGILTEAEAQLLADYDRRVMQIIDVDDFAPQELGLGSARTFPRAIAPTLEGDQTCAS
jgi:acyl-CoA dehydrogenase